MEGNDDELLHPVLERVSPSRRQRLEDIMRGGSNSGVADIQLIHHIKLGNTNSVVQPYTNKQQQQSGVGLTHVGFSPKRHISEIESSPGASRSGSTSLSACGNRTAVKRMKTPKKNEAMRCLAIDSDTGILSPHNSSVSSQHSHSSNGKCNSVATLPITDYFAKAEPNHTSLHSPCPQRNARIQQRERELQQREDAIAHREADLIQRERIIHDQTESSSEHSQQWIQNLQKEIEQLRSDFDAERTRATTVIIELLRKVARRERADRNAQLVRDNAQVGHRVPSRNLGEDTWEDGELFRSLHKKQALLKQERDDIDKERKSLTKKRLSLSRSPSDQNVSPNWLIDITEEEEILKLRTTMHKKDQAKLNVEESELEFRRKSHVRFARLLEEENRSRLSNHPVLNQRYVALHLIGKGGFSEVFKAFDLVEHRYVACKIHQLNLQWSLERRRIYTRHASREYEIHKQLQHARVVQLFDVFAIDDTCFCTVLEFCDGSDLDMHLKQVEVLPERAARCITMQIFSGLRYLNNQKRRIVHYDLKPGNILFQNGQIKIADFGLAKLLDENEGGSVELTSPGYGTYWYLPPECFDNGHRPATISSKVDVWSAGVIFYQMLYGKRPFGHDMTARNILAEKTILNATTVEFPAGKISEETKDFIRRCLAHRHDDRPEVLTIFDDPYFANTRRASTKN